MPCQAAAPGRLTLGRRDFTGFEQLLEPAQVLADGLPRVFTEEPGHQSADPAARRVVLEVDPHACPMLGLVEVHRSRRGDGRTLERLPGNQLVIDLVDDPGVPFHARPGWPG